MSFREIIPFVLAAVGGIGGLANALAGMEMVDALNTKRPADNQIPNPPVTRTEFAWFLKNPGFGYWGCRRKYRDQFLHGKSALVAEREHALDVLFFHCRCLGLCKGALMSITRRTR
jgi:hypothetical protein